MKLKSLLIIGGLSLALGASALAGISANKVNKEVVETSAYSRDGLTLLTSSNIATYASYHVVILSANNGNPEFQLAWNGSNLVLDTTGSLVEYQIGEVNNSKFTLYFHDTNHYLGEDGGVGFNKTSGLQYGFNSGYLERPSYDVEQGWELYNYPTNYIGWTKHSSGDADFYYQGTLPAYAIGDTRGYFYLYAITNQAIIDAAAFSRDFLQKTSGYCDAEVSEENINAIKYSWTHLSLGAQEAFYTAELVRGVGQVYSSYRSEAYSRYVNMATEMGYGNFLEIENFNPSSTNAINLSGSTDVIVIASVTAIVALAFTTLLLLKKKKANY